MISYQKISENLVEGRMEIENLQATDVFGFFQNQESEFKPKQKFILESRDVSHIYGRLSLVGIDPIIRVSGKDNVFRIEALNKRGNVMLGQISDEDLKQCDQFERGDGLIKGQIEKEDSFVEENQRSKRKNIVQVLRLILERFSVNKKVLMGLYGAFSYDVIRLFEDIDELLPGNDINDFDFCLYDSFVYFDLLKEKTEIRVYRDSEPEIDEAIHKIFSIIERGEKQQKDYAIENGEFLFEQEEYEEMVRAAKELARKGELFEVVFANRYKADFKGNPFGLYLKYREINPSPYLFYFEMGEDVLVGASPEMMVRVENNKAHLRPISGTAKRGKDPIEDHDNMLALLSNPKERAELDMLIDLGRNDLSRICKPGIEISDYRFVEKYSRVMHTVAHLTGELREDYTALDALIACMNAGTLTGAPKVAAMGEIEKHEKERRGFYGGTVGYFALSGEMDTGIIIRTAHIRDGVLDLKAGATLLYDSDETAEFQETVNKAQAFMDVVALDS